MSGPLVGAGLLLAASVLLAVGADLFTDNIGALASRFKVSALAVGVALAGAEPEEVTTAAIASLRDRPGLAAGDAIGASITVLTLILGLAAVALGVRLDRDLSVYASLAAMAALLAAGCLLDGTVTRPEGLILVAAYVVFIVVVWRRERVSAPGAGPAPGAAPGARKAPGTIIAGTGLLLMTIGGRVAIGGAERMVATLGRSDAAIGMTALGLVTSGELLALIWASKRHGTADLPASAVIGSVVCNCTLTLGVSAALRPLAAPGVLRTAVVVVVLSLGLAALVRRSQVLGRAAGAGLLTSYVLFVTVQLR